MSLLLTIVVAIIVAAVLSWAISQLPFTPDAQKYARVVIAVILMLWVLGAVFGYVPLVRIR